MTCTIVQKGVDSALSFYHYLRRKGYTHRSAVTTVLMYYSPNKEDLCGRLERRREYYQEKVYCTCCGRGAVTVFPCPECGEYICQDCAPDFGAHTCELE